jgi:pyridinium-3,5-biscarboxylic acid mononucleotide synthase
MTDPPVLNLGFARLDIARERRQGLAEVVYAPGKTVEHITSIVDGLLGHNSGPVLVTRVEADVAAAVRAGLGSGDYEAGARLLSWRRASRREFMVSVVSAGTADWPVAAEAEAVAAAVGLQTMTIHDVGVAGLDRLLAVRDDLVHADVVIAVAGMEGALASVIGGLVGCPVIAVPTSAGYGASLDGITALLAMHACCAAGVCVVGIDSGFGAAMAAYRIARALGGHR